MALCIWVFVGLVLGFMPAIAFAGSARRRGAVHVTGVFVLPTRERFSE
jgi:hypothetical protein